MSKTEKPTQGGSYTRQKTGGALKREEFTQDHPQGNRAYTAEGKPLNGRPMPKDAAAVKATPQSPAAPQSPSASKP